jgi:hypothetical protein
MTTEEQRIRKIKQKALKERIMFLAVTNAKMKKFKMKSVGDSGFDQEIKEFKKLVEGDFS